MVDPCWRSPNLWLTFMNHNHSWLLKIRLGEDNNSSTLEPKPIHLESVQLSRVIGTRTLTQNYCDAKPLSKFGLLIFLSMDLKLKSLGEGLLKSIFSEILSGAANGQCLSGVAIYSRSLPWWEMTIWDTRSSQWPTDTFTTVGFWSNGNITWGTSNANSSVRVKSLAAKKIIVSCWQVFARNTKRFLSQLS
mgnify:CR=1 FL=1